MRRRKKSERAFRTVTEIVRYYCGPPKEETTEQRAKRVAAAIVERFRRCIAGKRGGT